MPGENQSRGRNWSTLLLHIADERRIPSEVKPRPIVTKVAISSDTTSTAVQKSRMNP